MASGGVAKLKPLSYSLKGPNDLLPRTMEEREVLAGLASPSRRGDILEELRASVRRHGGRLRFGDQLSLFRTLQSVLVDDSSSIRNSCIQFLSEVIPEFGANLNNCMSVVLPELVSNIGHNQLTVRKSALQTLHVYSKHSEHVQDIFDAIIKYGLENEDRRTRTEVLIALPILITPNLSHEDLSALALALVHKLENSSKPESSPAIISLERIRNVVGEGHFDAYLRSLPSSLQAVYALAMKGRNSDVEDNGTRKAKSAGHLGYSFNDKQVEEAEGNRFDRGYTVATGSNSAFVRKGYAFGEETASLKFGFVPPHVMARLQDQLQWRVRAQGIEELKSLVEHLHDHTPLLPHLGSFFGMLLDFLDDSNFKITLTSLQIVGTLVGKLNLSVKPFLKPLVDALTNKLEDNKLIVFRQVNMKVFIQLMQILTPQPVLDVLTAKGLEHRSSRVREESLNVIIAALLTFPSCDFDLPVLTQAIAPMLIDTKRKVRQAALETFAVLAQAMGAGRLQPLVSAVDSIELSSDGTGDHSIMAAVQARLSRRQLPHITTDGLVEYAVPTPTSGKVRGQASSPRGADIEWIMAAGGGSSESQPSSARSTPGLNDSMNGGPSPRRYLSAGKHRLPWEEDLNSSNDGGKLNGDDSAVIQHASAPSSDQLHNETSFSNSAKKLKHPRVSTDTGSSYAAKHIAKTLASAANPEKSPVKESAPSSYAEMHRAKLKKAKTSGTMGPVQTTSGPNSLSAGGYSMIYKKGSINGKVKEKSNGEPQGKETRQSQSVSPYLSREDPNLLTMQRRSLSSSWPEWPDLPGRPRGHLTPVSPGFSTDAAWSAEEEFKRNAERDASRDADTPIHIKPQLARSASKKGRGLRTIELGELGNYDLDGSFNKPGTLAPVSRSTQPPTELLKQVRRQAENKRGVKMFTTDDLSYFSPSHSPTPSQDDETLSQADVEERIRLSSGKKVGDSPFDSRPRIARTPNSSYSRASSKLSPTPPPPPPLTKLDSLLTPGMTPVITDEPISGDVEIVGRSFGSRARSRRASDLDDRDGLNINKMLEKDGNTSDLGSSLTSTGGKEIEKNVEIVGKGIFEKDKEKGALEFSYSDQDSDEWEDDDEDDDDDDEDEDDDDDEEEEEDSSEEENNSEEDTRPKTKEEPVSAQSKDDPKTAEEERRKEKQLRKSLSKSTRERMWQRRQEEEEKAEREFQKWEEQEKEKVAKQKAEDEKKILQERIEKDNEEVRQILREREKEMELEKLKLKQLEEIGQTQRKSMIDKFQRDLEELEKSREREKQKEKLRQLQLRQQRDIERRKQQQQQQQQQQASEQADLTVSGSSKPVQGKPPSGTTPRKKIQTTSAHRESSYARTDEPELSSRHPSAGLSTSGQIWEVPLDNLQPFKNPENGLRDGRSYMSNDEWDVKCEGLQHVRRMCKHHPEVLSLQLHAVILAVLKEIGNLRSQVSRAAICCITDMFSCLGKAMEQDLEKAVKVLVCKAGESNEFIRNDVERALSEMTSSVTPTRAMVSLIAGGGSHRNVHVRRITSNYLSVVAEKVGAPRLLSGAKDVTDKILPTACQFAMDGGPETRYYGRKILYMLYEHPDFDKMVAKHVPESYQKSVRDIIDKLKTKGLGECPSGNSSAHHRRNNSGGFSSRTGSNASSTSSTPVASREGKRPKGLDSGGSQSLEVSNLIKALSSGDWKERYQATADLECLAQSNPAGISQHIVKVFDGFLKLIQDSNSKVNLAALQTLNNIIPYLRDSMIPVVPSLVPTVTPNLASKNPNIYSSATQVLEQLRKYVDNVVLVQPYCTAVQVGNVRVKPDMVLKLAGLIPSVNSQKPQLIQRQVLPTLWNLLGTISTGSAGAASTNLKSASTELCRVLCSCLGKNTLIESSSNQAPRIQQRLKDIIESDFT